MNKGMMFVLIIVALLVGAFGGYYFEKKKMDNQMFMLQSDMQKQLDSANMKNAQMQKDEMMLNAKLTVTPTGATLKK